MRLTALTAVTVATFAVARLSWFLVQRVVSFVTPSLLWVSFDVVPLFWFGSVHEGNICRHPSDVMWCDVHAVIPQNLLLLAKKILKIWLRNGAFCWRRGVVVSGVRRWTKLTHVGPGYNWDGWPSSGVYTISVCNQPTRSTLPCIPPGSRNRVPASAGVKAGMSPLPGGR